MSLRLLSWFKHLFEAEAGGGEAPCSDTPFDSAPQRRPSTPDMKVEGSRVPGDAQSPADVIFISDEDEDARAGSGEEPGSAGLRGDRRGAPYSLYVYVGVRVEAELSTSVLLVGRADPRSGLAAVELLDTLRLSSDSAPPGGAAPEDDARLLMDRLRACGLPLSGLCAFYCDGPPALSRALALRLRALSPAMLSFCALPGAAGGATQAGLLHAFPPVLALIEELHRLRPPALVDLLVPAYSPARSVREQPLALAEVVENLAGVWGAARGGVASLSAPHLEQLLRDDMVRLSVLFLSEALRPLRAAGGVVVGVAQELQLSAVLLRAYAAAALRPAAAARFLRRWDLRVLQEEDSMLPPGDMDIGASARDFLGGAGLGEQDQKDFFTAAATFYRAVLESLVHSVPQNLDRAALMTITEVLKRPEDLWVSGGTWAPGPL